MSKSTTNEFLVRYIADWGYVDNLVSSSCKTWNRTTINQLKRKFNGLDDIYQHEYKQYNFFKIAFQNGSFAYFLFIKPTINTFELHTALRVAFSKGIQENTNLSFNVLGLNRTHQKTCASALSGLVVLNEWQHPKYGKKAKKKNKTSKKNFGFYSDLENINEIIDDSTKIANGTNLARTLITTPTNFMQSKDLIDASRKIAKTLTPKSNFKFLGENKLKELGAGAFLSVLRGTKGSDGGIVHLQYKTRKRNPKKIAIIGKGIVFDTGGYTLKIGREMFGMHEDMTGAAVALGLYKALVTNKVQANIDLFLAVGENLVSEVAFKPNEVIYAMDGTSIEVGDTDAEGRMVLLDTILYAKTHDPDIIIDFATLTGACIYSLDTQYSALMSNDQQLAHRAVEIGESSGERVWSFPVSFDYMEGVLDTEIADVAQYPNKDNAGHIYAACLLKYFADPTKWVHIDLSACNNVGGLGLVDTTVTGFGVRWGYEFIKDFIEQE